MKVPAERAAIYTRKSTSAGLEQDFNSLDAQREACADYAKRQGWTVAGTYDDGGFTGANIDRPAFQRLLADVDAGKLDVVVVYKVVLRVLSNPIYAGLISAGGELHPAEHEVIVPHDQFERVRQMLGGHAVRPPRPGKNPAYLLRGLLYCGVCGAAMTPGGSRAYRYYRCVTRDKLGSKACASRPLPAQAAEAFVVERLHAAAADKAHIAEIQEHMRARFAAEKQALSAQRTALPARIGKLSADTQALATTVARVSGRAQKVAEEKLHATAASLERAQAELRDAEGGLAALKVAVAEAEWVRDSLSDFASLWELMTPPNRQRLVAAIVDRVDVNEAAGQITVRLAAMEAAA
jgi:hypothetical protein